jgi:hypothetical protein
MNRVLDDLQRGGITVNRDYLNYRRRNFDPSRPLPVIEINRDGGTNRISGLTSGESEDTVASELVSEINQSDFLSQRGRGRPTGTTLEAKVKRTKARADCINEITKCYIDEMEAKIYNNRQKTSNGFLTNLILNKWRQYGLLNCEFNKNNMVSPETIRNRFKKSKDKFALHCGTRSPLENIEELVCEILIQMGNIRQPLNVSESIKLANSLIQGSDVQQNLINFKTKQYNTTPSAATTATTRPVGSRNSWK